MAYNTIPQSVEDIIKEKRALKKQAKAQKKQIAIMKKALAEIAATKRYPYDNYEDRYEYILYECGKCIDKANNALKKISEKDI